MQQPANHSYAAITNVNIQDAVVNRIQDMILSGHLKLGGRLRQDELADTLGASTMPICEASRQGGHGFLFIGEGRNPLGEAAKEALATVHFYKSDNTSCWLLDIQADRC